MLETISQGFKSATDRLRGVRELHASNVDEALRDVRMSLLEADVDFGVVKDFLARVKDRSLGDKVETRVRDASGQMIKVTPGQHFIRVCEQELTELMGPIDTSLAASSGVTSIMLAGLQGVGKTTVASKLARHLQKQGKRPLLVAADIYRPAAVDQLKTLGQSIEVPVHSGSEGQLPPEICGQARQYARQEGLDAIIYDTAGRLALDDDLMNELEQIREEVDPANTLLVCDALMGRDAVNVAQAFAERIPLDGVVLTKLDGDARGGAALAVKAVTGVPIKFLGTGETVDRLEEFRPEGLASRILGMGDVVGLVKDFEEVVDEKQAEEDAERILKGQFTLDDLMTQLRTIQKMGPLKDVMAKLPMFGSMADKADDGELGKVQALIHSMTREERTRPEVINKSRAERIARGSGRKPKEVTELIERFGQMKKMMGSLGKPGGLLSRIPGMGGMMGGAPGEMPMDPAALLAGAGMGELPMGGSGRMRSEKNQKQRKNKRQQARKSRQKSRGKKKKK
ncbi:MAG: signal recognition particle protein [Deltaproteobacteria bacterium]|nr:signal recognition particle protein [Deltaproteobacteria bacterium]